MTAYARTISADTTYDPRLVVTGVSFRTLDIDGRERLARKVPDPEILAERLLKEGIAREAAVISTCNRFEIVSIGAEGGGLRRFFESLLEIPEANTDVLYQYTDASAVRHLYRVSSSLDSMLVGEVQILGQVKKAYQRAIEIGSVGSHLHYLFQSAFHVAKKVRTHTDIARNGVSLSYVAVRLSQQIFSDLSKTSVLIIGSGEMAELAALHLCSHGCRKIIVANRTVERAAELAERFGGLAVSLGDVDRALEDVDIVIGSISIDRPILTSASVRSRGGSRPLFLIDLGVPRNFAPTLADVDNVYLYNIDDLAAIAAENKALRDAAAKEAEIVIDYGLLQFERWRKKLEASPAIIDIRARIEHICRSELSQALPKDLESQAGAIESLTHALSRRIGHELTAVLERHTGVASGDREDPPFLLIPRTSRE
jgi:glutamyl-tRNA reductase